jgi:mitochondrial import inner membrane translocase subunit TIM13
MDFSSQIPAGGKLDATQRAQLMSSVKQQLAIAKAQELLEKINDKCFKMCLSKPGSSLSSSDQKCLTNCMDRYLDAWNAVSKTYMTRIQKELGGMK